jgi:hypothetical protein
MLVIYLLPWFVLLLLLLLGAIVSTHIFGHLSKRNHAPEMFDTALLGPIPKLLAYR